MEMNPTTLEWSWFNEYSPTNQPKKQLLILALSSMGSGTEWNSWSETVEVEQWHLLMRKQKFLGLYSGQAQRNARPPEWSSSCAPGAFHKKFHRAASLPHTEKSQKVRWIYNKFLLVKPGYSPNSSSPYHRVIYLSMCNLQWNAVKQTTEIFGKKTSGS